MSYTITKGETRTFPRAYALHGVTGIRIYTGNVATLTKSRKATIVSDVLTSQGREVPNVNLADMFDVNPFLRRDNLTIEYTTLTNDETGDVKALWSYSYSAGSGSWEFDKTTFVTVH